MRQVFLGALSLTFSLTATVCAAQTVNDFLGLLGQTGAGQRSSNARMPSRYPPSPPLPPSERALLDDAQLGFNPQQNLLPYKDCRDQIGFVDLLQRGMAEELNAPQQRHVVEFFGVPIREWTVNHVVEADHFMTSCRGQGTVSAGFFARDFWPAVVAARPAAQSLGEANSARVEAFKEAMDRVIVSASAEREIANSVDPDGIRKCLIGNIAADMSGADTARVDSVERTSVRTRDRRGEVHTRSSFTATGSASLNGRQQPITIECSPLPGLGWARSG